VHDGKGVRRIIFGIPGPAHKKLLQVYRFFLVVIDFYKVFPVASDTLISAKKTGKRRQGYTFLGIPTGLMFGEHF
jgi:hypothetical protein